MLVMVTFVGLLIFIYSTGYMEPRRKLHALLLLPEFVCWSDAGSSDSNSILLLFMCGNWWGSPPILLIGFWLSEAFGGCAGEEGFF